MDAKELICSFGCGEMKKIKSEKSEYDKKLRFDTYKCPKGHLMTEGVRNNPYANIPFPWIFGV